jgi:hypothetical protein
MNWSKYLFILFPILFFVNTVYTQEYALRLEKIRNGKIRKTKIFEEGTLLVIRTETGRHRGIFAVKDSASIILEGGEIIKLRDIVKFRKPNGRLFGGLTLTIAGGLTFWGGLLVSSFEGVFEEDTNDTAENVTMLGFLAMTTGTVLMANYNHKPIKRNWNLSIMQR